MGRSWRSLTAPVVLPCWPSAMPRRFPVLLLASVVIAAFTTLGLFIFTMGRPLASPPLPPNPNGYDDFLRASALLAGDVYGASTLNHDDLWALVSTNAEPLRLMRLGLTRQCGVPTDATSPSLFGRMSQLAEIHRLALLVVAEGRLREMEGRPGDAAMSYVEAIRLGNETSRGGFHLNRLMGVLCEMDGFSPLAKLVAKLTCAETRPVMAELDKVERARITWDEIQANDRWNESRIPLQERITMLNPVVWVKTSLRSQRSRQTAEQRHKVITAYERLLAVEIALRCYESEQGRVPARLEQLVPQYLQRVPSDPFSGRLMIYRPQGTNWLVYSVGEDGVDDGGKRMVRSVSGTVTKGDLFYDSPY